MSKAKAALELVLLFHSAGPWDDEKRNRWINLLTQLLGDPVTRKDENGFHYKVGNLANSNEATTRNLCNAVRAALEEQS